MTRTAITTLPVTTLLILLLCALAAPAQAGEVARAQFTSGISDREPADRLDHIAADSERAWFFSELRDLEGQTVHHRWVFRDEIHAEIPFDIGGPRWRVWSSKALSPEWHGQWTVEIVREDGRVLDQRTIRYGD